MRSSRSSATFTGLSIDWAAHHLQVLGSIAADSHGEVSLAQQGRGWEGDGGLTKAPRPNSIILLFKLTRNIRPEAEPEAIYKQHPNTLGLPPQVLQRPGKLRWDATKHLAWHWQVLY
jgi:hypothetical protein